jgi:hypothetical protein
MGAQAKGWTCDRVTSQRNIPSIMSAAAKAEARRKAILSRGSDRLSKLTTSARGDDAPQFVHTGKPQATLALPSSNT